MIKKIYKYPIVIQDEQVVLLPTGAKIYGLRIIDGNNIEE